MSIVQVKAYSYVGDIKLTDMTVFLTCNSSTAMEDSLEQSKTIKGDYLSGFHMLAR